MSQPEPAGPVQFATDDGRVRVGDWVRFVYHSLDKGGQPNGRLVVGVVMYVLPDKGGGSQDIVTDAGTVSSADVLEVRSEVVAASPAEARRRRA